MLEASFLARVPLPRDWDVLEHSVAKVGRWQLHVEAIGINEWRVHHHRPASLLFQSPLYVLLVDIHYYLVDEYCDFLAVWHVRSVRLRGRQVTLGRAGGALYDSHLVRLMLVAWNQAVV